MSMERGHPRSRCVEKRGEIYRLLVVVRVKSKSSVLRNMLTRLMKVVVERSARINEQHRKQL